MIYTHEPVLVGAILEFLRWDRPVRVLDLTVGLGGHLSSLLRVNPAPSRVVAYDQDPQALELAAETLAPWKPFVEFRHANFSEVPTDERWDRILIDLGVSSLQLDDASRGFSFRREGPLDMRMNPTVGRPVCEWLREAREEEIADVIYRYGEEPRSRVFARDLVKARKEQRLETTWDLVTALGYTPESKNREGRHPLTRVFQGLRLWVNQELEVLDEILKKLPVLLAPEGRVSILTFHSLEDRAVKWALKGKLRALTKHVVVGDREEVLKNPRARSAKLRVYEKVEPQI